MRLPLAFPPLPVTAVLGRTASRPARPRSFDRPSPNVVRLPLMTGADRGLKTLGFQSFSFSLFTIRRECDAVNVAFSPGGLPDVAAVGLRLRWARTAVLDVFK